VIALLNTYFVPVYASNEDYRGDGWAPPDERKERDRIYREALAAKLSAGTVHAYVTGPDGHTIDSRHVANAAKVDNLTEMLEKTVERLNTKPGKPLAPPAPQSKVPKAESGDLVLHLTARNLVPQGNDFVIPKVTLGETRSGNWGAYPGEDWIILSRAEWTKLLPDGDVKPGQTWELNRDVTAKLLLRFYPSTENNDVKTNVIEKQEMKATILSVKDGVATARLDGSLRMKHPFYHKDDDNVVSASFVGVVEFDTDKTKMRALHIATDRAVYGPRLHFGVAVRSVP
jgi:hypothetical protein